MRIASWALAVLALVGLIAAPQAVAENPKHQGPACNVEKQSGDWGFVALGKNAGVDIMATGTYHLNKDGTSSSHLFFNTGTNFLDFNRTGNTTIKDDCTMTQTWTDGGPAAHCVIVDDGDEIWCMYEPPLYSQVTLKRLHTRD